MPGVGARDFTAPDETRTPDKTTVELALAADPEGPLDEDAVPWICSPDVNAGLLPVWYMPAASAGGPRIRGWRRAVILSVVVALLLIAASGLCSTYGRIVLA